MNNLSRQPEQEYVMEGLHEALITELSKIGALRVISRTSSVRYRNSNKALPQSARELDVDAIVEGSVLRSGNRLRVTAQLVQADPERHLWADSFDRELTDARVLGSAHHARGHERIEVRNPVPDSPAEPHIRRTITARRIQSGSSEIVDGYLEALRCGWLVNDDGVVVVIGVHRVRLLVRELYADAPLPIPT